MTLLDAMIAVGGLSEFAAGNKARLIRFDKTAGKHTAKAGSGAAIPKIIGMSSIHETHKIH